MMIQMMGPEPQHSTDLGTSKLLNITAGELDIIRLEKALSESKLQSMEKLVMSDGTHPDTSIRLLRALEQGICPKLRWLDFRGAKMDEEHIRVLGEAMSAGATPSLQVLQLSENGAKVGTAVKDIAFNMGTNITHLELKDIGIQADGATALARALSSMKDLQKLVLDSNLKMGDQSTAEIIKAITSCANLKHLSLISVGIKEQGVEAVCNALRNRAWSNLTHFAVSVDYMELAIPRYVSPPL